MAINAANKLEHLRRVAKDIGAPVECIDALAISVTRAARLLDVHPRTLRTAFSRDGMRMIRIEGSDRVDMIDFVEFIERHKVHCGSERNRQCDRKPVDSETVARLRLAAQSSARRNQGS